MPKERRRKSSPSPRPRRVTGARRAVRRRHVVKSILGLTRSENPQERKEGISKAYLEFFNADELGVDREGRVLTIEQKLLALADGKKLLLRNPAETVQIRLEILEEIVRLMDDSEKIVRSHARDFGEMLIERESDGEKILRHPRLKKFRVLIAQKLLRSR